MNFRHTGLSGDLVQTRLEQARIGNVVAGTLAQALQLLGCQLTYRFGGAADDHAAIGKLLALGHQRPGT